jgi:hypothetical protein
MLWLKLAVIALALVLGIWMLVDGARALTVGDYVTPRSGEYAGRLGPWATLVSAMGLDPRSTGVKGRSCWPGPVLDRLRLDVPVRAGMGCMGPSAAAALSLWYLPFGTLIGTLVLVLLFLLP